MTHSTVGRVKVAGLQPAQVLAGLLGLVFLAFGVVGFLRTGFGDFAGDQHAMVLGFAVNPLHNTIHLAFGVLGLLMATGSGLARLYGWIVFLAYGAVLLWGLALAGVFSGNPVSGLGNPLALNTNDNWLHLGFAVVGLLIAVLPARRKIVVPEETVEPVEAHPVDRDESIRDAQTRELPTQRVDTHRTHGDRHHDDRVESADPTVTARPVHPIDPAVAEQQRARHFR
ncbi:DUF4383 domain-containing protein [Saccharothrix yanglingensis]|uniref:DUF4383 domain-containing protein n=1 Tax=Saccharothrix yanglingensis TaxID=659496 RepID=A0ABU0X711_9PSEU|nr:DUF4383 domain-containing protein [Saccharothrix yanglingensis]MDQ2587766.1 hypothetical protein [Saccharothrix yanglingensis]